MNRIQKWMTRQGRNVVSLLVLLMSSALFVYCTWAWLDDSQSLVVTVSQPVQMQADVPVSELDQLVTEDEEILLPEPEPEASEPPAEELPSESAPAEEEAAPEPAEPPAQIGKQEVGTVAREVAPAIAEGKKQVDENAPEETPSGARAPDEGPPMALMGMEDLGQVHSTVPYIARHEHKIPLYYQNDYPDNRYGVGTIATNGCGITSLAMVATYITGHEYLPDELDRWFGGRAENNIKRMEIGATTMGLPWYQAENILVATEALNSGKIVIMMMDGFAFDNPFTTTQHFIVIRGITEEGRYLVHDPNRQNYQKPELREGFEKGFTFETLVAGYGGAWVFSPQALPENYKPYHKNEPPRQDNYPGLHLTAAEQELIAKLIWAEARGESAEGQQAVAEVVLNRYVSGQFGDSIEWVVMGPGQFRGAAKIEDAEPWQAQYDAIDAARYGVPVLEKDVFYFATKPMTSQVYAIIGGHVFCRAELPKEPEPEEPTQPAQSPEPTELEEEPAETAPNEPCAASDQSIHLQTESPPGKSSVSGLPLCG